MDKSIFLKPRLTEQTYQLAKAGGVYVFDVPQGANKHTVARAVAAQFEVSVAAVNIANIGGKSVRVLSKGGRRVSRGTRSDVKKAYVTLAAGQTLPFFDEQVEAEAEEVKAAEKAAKKADKKEKK